MSEGTATPRVLHFGDFEVDLSAGRVRKHGSRVSLREKSFQVLALLLEHGGEVVTRDEFFRRLWPGDVFVDFDNNLNTAIAQLREALGESAEHPRFIETLPKRGYRFIASVFSAPRALPTPPAPRARLVVLPFVNLSGDPAKEYFSDAVTDEVITELATLAPEQLAVIARTTAMRYKGDHKDVAGIGRQLNVEYVLEGGIHRNGDRLAVNVQLIRARDQVHVWAERYDAALSDLLDVQRSISGAVAARIGITLHAAPSRPGTASTAASVRKPTKDLIAYNEYIQGRYHLARLSPEGLGLAQRHLEAALARDAESALTHDSLAEVYWWLGYFGFMRPIEAFSTGVLHALRALEIDNTLAETHALLAQYHKQLDYNWREVETEMARALALNAASPVVRLRYATNFLMPQGRLAEAVTELQFALELDPLAVDTRAILAVVFVLWRRYDRALAESQRVIELDPRAPWGHLVSGSSYRELKMFDEAIAANQRAVSFSGNSAALLGWLGLTLGTAGRSDEARALLARLYETAEKSYVPPTSFAWVHLGLGEVDKAFGWLDRAVDERDQLMMPIKSYAFFDPIRSEPRFYALLRKMRLED